MLDDKFTSWSNLGFKSRRYSNRNTCGYDHLLVWFDYHGIRNIGSDVHAAGSCGRIRWKGVIGLVDNGNCDGDWMWMLLKLVDVVLFILKDFIGENPFSIVSSF